MLEQNMLNTKNIKFIGILILYSTIVQAQNSYFAIGPWKQQSLSGTLTLEALYRARETKLKGSLADYPKLSILSGKFALKSTSYVWHPNFLFLDADLAYNPSTHRENFLVIPDRSEAKTAESARIQATFFKERPMVCRIFGNITHNYVSREYLTNIETHKVDYGSALSFRNKFLPFSINYQQGKWNQKELQTNRIFKNKTKKFTARTSKSFSLLDEHQLSYTFDQYSREYSDFLKIENAVSSIDFRNKIYFNKDRESSLFSIIQSYNQTGTFGFNRFQLYEAVAFKLPKNFRFATNYQYYKFGQEKLKSNQHNVTSRLEHQLYLSLKTYLFHEYSFMDQTNYKELYNIGGINFHYQKKIPTGLLTLQYEHRLRHQNRGSSPLPLTVINEEHQLVDDSPVLLDNPFVDINSIIITDATETIIYQKDIDYILIERENYIEVQRLPGGQIENGQTVYIDYTVYRQESYKFDMINKSFFTSIILFHRFLEVYYRSFEQDYQNIHTIEPQVLKYVSQYVYGGRLTIGSLSGGAEYNNFESNIIPYQLRRYFLNIYGIYLGKLNLSLLGNWREYYLTESKEKQIYSDISGKALLEMGYQTTMSMEGAYRHQEGRGINLDLITLRGEFTTQFRRVSLTLGFELFRRTFYQEIINFNGIFARLEREF